MLGAIDGYAQVAQSVEHVLGKDEVGGSIPLLGFCPDWNLLTTGKQYAKLNNIISSLAGYNRRMR